MGGEQVCGGGVHWVREAVPNILIPSQLWLGYRYVCDTVPGLPSG